MKNPSKVFRLTVTSGTLISPPAVSILPWVTPFPICFRSAGDLWKELPHTLLRNISLPTGEASAAAVMNALNCSSSSLKLLLHFVQQGTVMRLAGRGVGKRFFG